MVITFVANTSARPRASARVVYEFANGMRRRGHEVHLIHRALQRDVYDLRDVSWCAFEAGIEHHIAERFGRMALPSADFICDAQRSLEPDHGLPLLFVQGHGIGRLKQLFRMRKHCPKVCIASWLVEDAIAFGISASELVRVRPGLDHASFSVTRPIEKRPRRVAMMLGSHPIKGTDYGIEALETVKAALPDIEAIVFARHRRPRRLPDWITFVRDPPVDALARDVYNKCAVYLCPSISEGFGYPSVEAMACGCALVTTRNGGSDEYAFDGTTALTCDPGDAPALARHLVTLITDEARRGEFARAGNRLVEAFTWDASARELETFLDQYGAAPTRYGFVGWEEFAQPVLP